MAYRTTKHHPQVDLLLRKSQVMRGTAPRDILSLKAQETRGRKWAKTNGYVIRSIWRENLSAYKTNVRRPEFDKAVQALIDGESDCLWVYDSSRFSRKGAGDVLKILDVPGKRLVFDLDKLDSQDPADRSRIVGRAEDAREYSRVLSEKVRDTKAEQRNEGKWLANAPYGLKATKNRKLKPNKWWPVVERIHHEAADGRSQRDIAAGLIADGYKAPRGGPWRAVTVGKILRNPVYLGWQVVRVRSSPEVYRNPKGKRVRVFVKGFEGIPQEIWDKHRRIVGQWEPAEGFSRRRSGLSAPVPVSGLMWCAGGGFDPKKGHRATSDGRAFRCGARVAGIPCPAPATALRDGVTRVVYAAWRAKLTAPAEERDPLLMLAVAERWTALSQPEETHAESEARGQLRLAQEAIMRLDRLNDAGAYVGREGEATFVRMRRAASREVEAAQAAWEAVAMPLGDVTVLTDPERVDALWGRADDAYRGQLLRLAIDRVFLLKADYRGQRMSEARLVFEWAKPRLP